MGLFDAMANIFGSVVDYEGSNERQQAQNDWNEKMWEKDAEWNSPANQMKLMTEAGINPAFAAAGISGAPVYTPPATSQAMPMSNAFSQLGTKNAMADYNRSMAEINEETKPYIGRLNQAEIDKAYSEIMQNESYARLNDEQKKVVRESLEMLKGKTSKEIEKMSAEIGQIKKMGLEIDAVIEKLNAETENVRKDTANKEAMHEQIEAGTENIEQDTKLKEQETATSKSIENVNINQLQKLSAEIGLINTQKELIDLQKATQESQTQLNKAEIANKIRDAILKDVEIFFKSRGAGNGLAGDLARLFVMHVFNGDQDPNHLDYQFTLDNVLQQMESLGEPIEHPKLVFPSMNQR